MALPYKVVDCTHGILSQKEAIFDGLVENGAVALINHDVNVKLIDDVFKKSHEFFNLPVEAKEKCSKYVNGAIDLHSGYVGINSLKRTDNTTEKRETFRSPVYGAADVTYPKELPTMGPLMDKLKDELYIISRHVLGIVAEKLNFDKEWFLQQHASKEKPNFSNAKFNYYPPIGDDEPFVGTRFVTHTDFLTLSIVMQDQAGGLEFMNRNEEFSNADLIQPAMFIFASDFLERYTGGLLKAKVHRVSVPSDLEQRKKPRVSLIYIIYPNNDTIVEPLTGDKKLYEAVKVDQYVEDKNERIYAMKNGLQ